MTERSRNVAVGLTVLVGLGLLGALIVLFAGLPEMFKRGYTIEIHTDTTAGAGEGDWVYMGGLRVGRITEIRFTDPEDPLAQISIFAKIDEKVNVPGDVKCYLIRQMMGSVYIELDSSGEPLLDPETHEPLRFLPRDRIVPIPTVVISSDPMSAFKPAVDALTELARNINKLLKSFEGDLAAAPAGTAPTTGPATRPGAPSMPPGIGGVIARLNRTLDAVHAVMGDSENQRNIKTSLANIAEASAAAKEAMTAIKQFAADARGTMAKADKTVQSIDQLAQRTDERIEKLTAKLIEDAEGISRLMTTVNQVAAKIDAGKGTAGKFVNDPAFYNNLVEASKRMNGLMKDLSALIKEWKANGVKIKLD